MSNRLNGLRGTPVVYRLYHDSQLLYVGETIDVARRFIEHATDKSWWYLVTRYQLTIATSKEHALQIESSAIGIEQPIFNIAHAITGSDNRRNIFLQSHPRAPRSWGWQPSYDTAIRIYYSRYGSCLPLSMTLPLFIRSLGEEMP